MNADELVWFKSSYSSGSGDDCVEVAVDESAATKIHVRDSKKKDGAQLTLPFTAWTDFLTHTTHD